MQKNSVDEEAQKMLDALEHAYSLACRYGFSSLCYNLDEMANGLAEYWHLERE